MKRTDLMKRERELKRARKKVERNERPEEGGSDKSVGDYISELNDLFYQDGVKIYNTQTDERILELFEEIKDNVEEKNWENILRKAVKKSAVKESEIAFNELKELFDA